MPEASCLCGKCTVSFSGEPQFKGLCYCKDCQKISGSTYSTNLVVPNDAFSLISGTPKQYSKPTDAGNTMTYNFCPDCGVSLWAETTGYPGFKLIKEGTLEAMSESKPTIEFYADHRVGWLEAVSGAKQQLGKS